uniref:Uncharacterized protein n=1 Tax=Avena sativa TaxID=4498 RepID=A0ACD5VDC4_AVESA
MAPPMLVYGVSAQMKLSYGIAGLEGRCPPLADRVAYMPSFMRMSPDMVIDYFGVFDGFFGAYSTEHQAKRLHVAIAKGIEDDLAAEAPRFLESPDDVDGWWKKTVQDAFRVVDDELAARVVGGVAVSSPAVVALVLKDYIVLAKRGATCNAVICRGEEAVQLTSEPCKNKEEQNAQNAEGHVAGSTSNLEDHMTTSRAISLGPYFPKPEVLMVDREPRDKFLILATGGFWDHITPARACSFVRMRLYTSPSTILPTTLTQDLAELAVCHGSLRNVTVTVILFNN